MIQILNNNFKYIDDRGSITRLIDLGNWREINYVKSVKGYKRGYHFHKITFEGFAIFEGKVAVTVQKVTENLLLEPKLYTFEKGSVFIIEPMVFHIFHILEDSIWINFLSNTIDSENPDIFKISSIYV